MQFKRIAFFIISVTMLFSGCNSKNDENKEVIKEEQTKFTLSTMDPNKNITIHTKDNLIKVEEEPNKIILLNFWATWCQPCKAEIPHLINLQKEYKENLKIIAINMGENDSLQTADTIKMFIEEYGINYTITNTNENFKLADAMGGIKSIPTMFMINQDGKMIQKYIGIVPEEMMEIDIKNSLGKI